MGPCRRRIIYSNSKVVAIFISRIRICNARAGRWNVVSPEVSASEWKEVRAARITSRTINFNIKIRWRNKTR